MLLLMSVETPIESMVFIIGSPRSGTSWLQKTLGSHPAIVTPQETDLSFRRMYVAGLNRTWESQLANMARRRYRGLPAVMTRGQFDHAVQAFCDAAVDCIWRLKPEASVVVEKSAGDSFQVEAIAALRPDARFIHIIHDGSDVI